MSYSANIRFDWPKDSHYIKPNKSSLPLIEIPKESLFPNAKKILPLITSLYVTRYRIHDNTAAQWKNPKVIEYLT